MNFIELSLARIDRKIYINPRHITSFSSFGQEGVTVLVMDNEHEYFVKESVEQILNLIPYGGV
jgi:uncharacterized protein YlzI (FlbEa/FlbD family)